MGKLVYLRLALAIFNILLVFHDSSNAGIQINQMQQLGTVESVKAISEIYSPISGDLMEVNGELSQSPELVNESPYEMGWLVLIKPSNLNAELEKLMDPKGYTHFLRSVLKK